MYIVDDSNANIVEIYLNKTEANDPRFQGTLQAKIQTLRDGNRQIVVFRSGAHDVDYCLHELVKVNRKLFIS